MKKNISKYKMNSNKEIDEIDIDPQTIIREQIVVVLTAVLTIMAALAWRDLYTLWMVQNGFSDSIGPTLIAAAIITVIVILLLAWVVRFSKSHLFRLKNIDKFESTQQSKHRSQPY